MRKSASHKYLHKVRLIYQSGPNRLDSSCKTRCPMRIPVFHLFFWITSFQGSKKIFADRGTTWNGEKDSMSLTAPLGMENTLPVWMNAIRYIPGIRAVKIPYCEIFVRRKFLTAKIPYGENSVR